MRKIVNPYPRQSGYKCFGCSPDNKLGLQMEFYEDEDSVSCEWNPTGHFEGYYNVLHGGIQSTLIDEAGSWYVQVKLKTAGVTSNLNVRYYKPVYIDAGLVKLRSTLIKQRRNLADIKVELLNSNNELCALGTVTYFTFSEDEAKSRLNYPGHEEF